SLYAQRPDSVSLDNGRREAANWAHSQLTGPVAQQLRTFRIGRLAERPINNAQLVGARIYRTRLDLFDRWFDLHGRDVSRSVSALDSLMAGVEGDSAYARLGRAVGDSSATGQ
ncbi:MAG TPA: hypothetical protein VNC19_09740, partial [Gemmatimonadales bacterium]|nr:hypothetical protein [Gemmatimonadales bacterium]